MSYPYAPIEQLREKQASKAYDIWATGVIFYQLLNYGKLPYDIKGQGVDPSVFDKRLPPLNKDDADALKMIDLMLERDQSKRPSAIDLLRLPYFSSEVDNFITKYEKYTEYITN